MGAHGALLSEPDEIVCLSRVRAHARQLLTFTQESIALMKNTGLLDEIPARLGLKARPTDKKRMETSMKASYDNAAEITAPLMLTFALLSEQLYVTALGGPQNHYDQGVFRRWRLDVSVNVTLLAMAIVFLLRCGFLRFEIAVSTRLRKLREAADAAVAPAPETAVESEETKAGISDEPKAEKVPLSVLQEWKGTLVKLMKGAFYGKIMCAGGMIVQATFIVTESAYYAYFVSLEDADDSASVLVHNSTLGW